MDPAALTEAQRDGRACVVCGVDLVENPAPSVPVETVFGVQIFACSSHDEDMPVQPWPWYAPPVAD